MKKQVSTTSAPGAIGPYSQAIIANGFVFLSGQVALDQIRAVDRQRLVRKLGAVPAKTALAASSVLVEMFTRQ